MRYPMMFLSCFCLGLSFSIWSASAWAQEKPKGPTCQSQLAEVTMQAHNLDMHRDQAERDTARLQVLLLQAQEQVKLLAKQLADANQATVPKPDQEPKTDAPQKP